MSQAAPPLIERLDADMTPAAIGAAVENLSFDDAGHALTLLRLDREVARFFVDLLRQRHAAQVER